MFRKNFVAKLTCASPKRPLNQGVLNNVKRITNGMKYQKLEMKLVETVE